MQQDVAMTANLKDVNEEGTYSWRTGLLMTINGAGYPPPPVLEVLFLLKLITGRRWSF